MASGTLTGPSHFDTSPCTSGDQKHHDGPRHTDRSGQSIDVSADYKVKGKGKVKMGKGKESTLMQR